MTRDSYRELIIESETGKGRAFRATLLGAVVCDGLWDCGSSETTRPVWAAFGGSEAELRSFTMNLRGGRKARPAESKSKYKENVYDFLRSAEYDWRCQRLPEGVVWTAHLPHLFVLDPGMVDPRRVDFVCMPDRRYLDAQLSGPGELDAGAAVEHALRVSQYLPEEEVRAIVPEAAMFSVMLSRRTRCPWPNDVRFFTQLYLACLRDGLATWENADRYRNWGNEGFGRRGAQLTVQGDLAALGLSRPVAFSARHEAFQELLVGEIKLFFEMMRSVVFSLPPVQKVA